MDSSSKLESWLSLAAAAFVGATVVAISAFWLHKRAIDQILDSANGGNALPSGHLHEFAASRHANPRHRRRPQSPLPHHHGIRSRSSSRERSSLHSDLPLHGRDGHKHTLRISKLGEEDCDALSSIPVGLPRVQTHKEEKLNAANNHAVSPSRRLGPLANPVMRATNPKSPGAGTGFDDVESSDEESGAALDHEDQAFEYGEVNGDDFRPKTASRVKEEPVPVVSDLPNGAPGERTGNHIIRSHSIPGELHGLHAPDPVAADILRKEPEQETFVRLQVTPIEAPSTEEEEVCRMMLECLALRQKYVFREQVAPWFKEEVTDPSTPKPNPDPFHYEQEPASQHFFQMIDGVVHVYPNAEAKEELFPVFSATEFFTDMHRVLKITSLGNVRTLCHHRLRLLEQKFSLHLMLNADREFLAQKSAPHRDFYNVRKVDTHVHHSACMNQKHLLRFIKSKLRKEPDEVVIFRDGKYLTLKEVFESLDLTGYDLNVDLLDVHADKNTFHRFDKFNLKYNPFGQSRLREIFLKQDNLIQGRFLAELTKEVFQDLEQSKYQFGGGTFHKMEHYKHDIP